MRPAGTTSYIQRSVKRVREFGDHSMRLYPTDPLTEDHAVARNWRALTHRTIRLMDSRCEDLPRQIVGRMIKRLGELLASCGVGDSAENTKNIHQCAAERLEAFFVTAQKLNKMIGEDVVSEDLKVVVIQGGAMFDGQYMEDAYAPGGVKSVKRAVICTTDLGLCSRHGTNGVEKMLLKPKVALRDI